MKSQTKANRINTQWFRDRLADKSMSQRGYAKQVEMDPSAVSLMLRGRRKMTMDEAVQFASLVGVPLDDVMSHAGLRLPSTGKNTCPITGSVDSHGAVTLGPVAAPRRAPLPPEAPSNTAALRFRIAGGAGLDGWLAYYAEDIARVPAEAIGRLCVVELDNHGGARLGFVKRGYERATWTVLPWSAENGLPLENVRLEKASPVLWIRTGA